MTTEGMTDAQLETYQRVYVDMLDGDSETAVAVADLFTDMGLKAEELGKILAEYYNGLSRKSERKMARRIIHSMLNDVSTTLWAEIRGEAVEAAEEE